MEKASENEGRERRENFKRVCLMPVDRLSNYQGFIQEHIQDLMKNLKKTKQRFGKVSMNLKLKL